MSFLRPTEIVLEGVACHVCGRFVKGRCLNSEDKCVKEIPSACEAKVFFTIVNNGKEASVPVPTALGLGRGRGCPSLYESWGPFAQGRSDVIRHRFSLFLV